MRNLGNKLVVSFAFLCTINIFAQESRIFWIDQSLKKLQSSKLNGSDVTDVVTDVQAGEGIAIDSLSSPMKIYYSESGLSRIVRMNFDGSNPEEVVTDIVGLEEIDLDLVNRKIYWLTDIYSEDKVQRADMDGLNSNIDTLYTNSYAMHGFYGIGVNPENQWVYWTQFVYGRVDRINRINFDGTGRTTIGNYLSPRDIDVVGNKIYWSWPSEDLIMRANLDGSDVDTVITGVNTHFFVLDTTYGKVFWTESNKIKCANLDNTGMEELVTGLGNTIRGITLYFNPLNLAVEANNAFPYKYELAQNYPNPFNPITNIEYRIPNSEFVTLKIYNALGQKVVTLESGRRKAGFHIVEWNASDFASGVYYYKLQAGEYVASKKLVLLK